MRASYDYEHVVTLEETNLLGNVYYINHLRWQGRCRELFLRERTPAVLEAFAESLVFVTTRCSCEYFAELYAFDRVTVRMTLSELRQNRIVMRFDYVRRNETSSELVARGEQEIACMERSEKGLRPTPVPEELQAALVQYGLSQTPLMISPRGGAP